MACQVDVMRTGVLRRASISPALTVSAPKTAETALASAVSEQTRNAQNSRPHTPSGSIFPGNTAPASRRAGSAAPRPLRAGAELFPVRTSWPTMKRAKSDVVTSFTPAGNHHAVAQNRVAVADFHNLPAACEIKTMPNVLFLAADAGWRTPLRFPGSVSDVVGSSMMISCAFHQQRAADFRKLFVRRIQIAHHLWGSRWSPMRSKRGASSSIIRFADPEDRSSFFSSRPINMSS